MLVFLQPDAGTALVYTAVLAAVLFVVGRPLAPPGADRRRSAAARVLAVLWWLPAAGVQRAQAVPDRPPHQHELLQPHASRRSRSAPAALRGRGVAGATQTALDYLPAHATDFAFASLAEQRGFLGASILLLLSTCSSSGEGSRSSRRARDLFGAIVAAGIVFAFLFQVFVNVGMTMGIAPITGIPLPFVSVGGSSMITNLAGVGVLLAIHARGGRRRA